MRLNLTLTQRFALTLSRFEAGDKPYAPVHLTLTLTLTIIRLGIRLTRRSIKLYTEFYTSDIIVASPLGLRRMIGVEGDVKREYDFLSSIEVSCFPI